MISLEAPVRTDADLLEQYFDALNPKTRVVAKWFGSLVIARVREGLPEERVLEARLSPRHYAQMVTAVIAGCEAKRFGEIDTPGRKLDPNIIIAESPTTYYNESVVAANIAYGPAYAEAVKELLLASAQ